MPNMPSVEAIMGGKASASGIVERSLTGERVLPESRRADGSVRKERKIRPGYTPPEDVAKFKSARQQDAEKRSLPRGVVPGMGAAAITAARAAAEQAAAGGKATEASKAAKKNAKRREKRDEDEDRPAAAKANVDEVKDSWEEEAEDAPPPTEAAPAADEEGTKEVDPEKRQKALNKKLRQAEALRDRSKAGEALLPEQEEKVASIPSLEEELAKLLL